VAFYIGLLTSSFCLSAMDGRYQRSYEPIYPLFALAKFCWTKIFVGHLSIQTRRAGASYADGRGSPV